MIMFLLTIMKLYFILIRMDEKNIIILKKFYGNLIIEALLYTGELHGLEELYEDFQKLKK